LTDTHEPQDPTGDSRIQRVPDAILKTLNTFDAHTRRKQTCLACGYVGIMGIEDELHPWWLSWWCIALVTVFGSLFMGAGLVIGGILIGLRFFGEFDTLVLVCPNCEEAYEQD
jgi:hypothetical protein